MVGEKNVPSNRSIPNIFRGLQNTIRRQEPFDASMMVHFRKRFPVEIINEINELVFISIAREAIEREETKPPCSPTLSAEGLSVGTPDKGETKSESGSPSIEESPGGSDSEDSGSPTESYEPVSLENKGKLILDATCAPADIRFPTDLSLLNEARENMEEFIDLYPSLNREQRRKVLQNRKIARKKYLSITKQKRPGIRKIRAAIGIQLKYLWKNIERLGSLMLMHGTDELKESHLQRIMTVCELYRQQQYMLQNKTHQCENRIVSLRQPHIRPIVRGKVGTRRKVSLRPVCILSHGRDLRSPLSHLGRFSSILSI